MSVFTYTKLQDGVDISNTGTAIYQAPVGSTCVIQKVTFTNRDVTPRLLTVNIFPSGGAANPQNRITVLKTMFPNETWNCIHAEGHILEAQDTLYAIADVANMISAVASGLVVT